MSYSATVDCIPELNVEVAIANLPSYRSPHCLPVIFSGTQPAASRGFDSFLGGLTVWGASMQQCFCNTANIGVAIVQCREQLLVSSQIPSSVPLQMANKEVQRVTMFYVLRHLNQLDLLRRSP
jgi:hypothetical protein